MQKKNIPTAFIWLMVIFFHRAESFNFLSWLQLPFRFSYFSNEIFKNPSICETRSCLEASQLLREGLNEEVDPCVDFYEFACGKWPISRPIPLKSQEIDRHTHTADQLSNRLLHILESEETSSDSPSIKLMKNLFKDCMDLENQEKEGLKPINNVLGKLGSTWPLIGHDISEISWQEVDEYYRELMGRFSTFRIHVTPAYATRTQHRLTLSPEEFPLIQPFELSSRWNGWPEKTNLPYAEFMKKVARIFLHERGLNYTEKELEEEIFHVLQFEHDLYQALGNASDTIYDANILELQKHYDGDAWNNLEYKSRFNWLKAIRKVFAAQNVTINEDEIIFVNHWNYFSKLESILNSTSNRVIVNYINWRFVSTMIPFTTPQMKSIFYEIFGKNYTKSVKQRRYDCIIEFRLNPLLYREYARKFFPKSFKLDVLKMCKSIQEQALAVLEKSDWLDNYIRQVFMNKIKNIQMIIGYPDWYDDENVMSNYYQKFRYGHSHFNNTLNNIKFLNDKNLERLRQPMEKYEWQLEPVSVNAKYLYFFNALLLPMVYADSPIYSKDLPTAVKYGILGFIIGHEIFHALDPHGIKYDKNWEEIQWPEKTMDEYQSRVRCIINQLNNYQFSERDPTTGEAITIQANGSLSKKEDMADIEGICVAFKAYKFQVNRNNNQRLIGLEQFNADKLFFISFASRWCHSARIDWWKDNYGSNFYDDHSPSRLRINSALRNFEEFSKTFNCLIGSQMNQQPKCFIFDKPTDLLL